MPTEHQFKWFGIVMATVCIPFFLLIGSLNTTSGMEFWRTKWHLLLTSISNWLSPSPPRNLVSQVEEEHKSRQSKLFRLWCFMKSLHLGTGIEKLKQRSLSASQAMQIRNAQIKPLAIQPRLSVSVSTSKDAPPSPNEEEGEKRPPAVAASDSMAKSITLAVESPPKHGKRREASWWEKVLGRKTRLRGFEV